MPENDIMPATSLAPELIQEIKHSFPVKSDYAAYLLAGNYDKVDISFVGNDGKTKVRHTFTTTSVWAKSHAGY